MKDNEIIKSVMKQMGYSSPILAKKLGFTTPSGVTERLRGKQAMRCDTFVRFLKEMNCEVVVRSTLTDKTEWTLTFDKE